MELLANYFLSCSIFLSMLLITTVESFNRDISQVSAWSKLTAPLTWMKASTG